MNVKLLHYVSPKAVLLAHNLVQRHVRSWWELT